MRLYIGRTIWDEDGVALYELGTVKGLWSSENGFTSDVFLFDFYMHPKKFEKIFRIKLAPGEIRKVKSIKIELEE